MIAKIYDKDGEIDLTELTEQGLIEAKNQAEQLIQDIENELNSRNEADEKIERGTLN